MNNVLNETGFSMQVNIDRLMTSLEAMWQIGATANGGVTRPALSDEDRAARDLLQTWFEDAGMDVRVDDFGNMRGRRQGIEDLPPVMIGSHLDSVPQGGRYDGALGVTAGLEIVQTLNDHDVKTKRPIEIVNWTGEEGTRFRPALIGSRAALGRMEAERALSSADREGITVAQELQRIGYAGDAANRPTNASAYLELHIEQGPVLEAEDFPVGLVQGIIGQTWFDVTVNGRAGHAGANPMHLRADALVAASQLVLDIRQLAVDAEQYSVATVGQMSVEPGAMNVVPARVWFTVDLRCATTADMQRITAGLEEAARKVEAREGVSVSIVGSDVSESKAFDPTIMDTIRDAIRAKGLPVRELWSGAGHDAGPAAHTWPTGMIFVRSKDGLSHAEAEYSSPEDIAAATNVLLRSAVSIANR